MFGSCLIVRVRTANQIDLAVFLAAFQSSPMVLIPIADQKDCSLWGRDCIVTEYSLTFLKLSVSKFFFFVIVMINPQKASLCLNVSSNFVILMIN